jgi:hypothetical protein
MDQPTKATRSTMPNAQVKIFGERNTGTNALKRLIEQNSRSTCLPGTSAEIDAALALSIKRSFWLSRRERERRIDRVFAAEGPRFAWKHCATRFEDGASFDGVLVLFLVRHPASWLLSLSRNPYNAVDPPPSDIGRFLEFEWQTVARERLGEQAYKPLDLFASKIDSYFALSGMLTERGIAHHFLRLEDLILAQEQTFARVKPDLCGAEGAFQPLRRSTKSRHKDLRSYGEYYAGEQWRQELAGFESAINERVDWAQVERFGYAPI